MKIKKIEFKNINSYGNNLQTIDIFDEAGSLSLLYGNNGNGKCLSPDTEIVMYDGNLKKAKDIEIGDLLMGPDSKKRTVIQLHNGYSNMYKVSQINGIDYIVTENHKLSLRKTGEKKEYYLSPKEYLSLNKSKQRLYSGHITEKIINFQKKDVKINPYILGLWLGDGTLGYKYEYINEYNFRDLLNHYNLLKNKHIPNDYICNTKDIRLELLAGLIDSDGYAKKNTLTITQKNKKLIDDIELMCNSLGFKTKLRKIKKSIKKINLTDYYELNITSNDLSIIPLRIERKKNQLWKNKENEDKSRTVINISYHNYSEYYGFTLKEDPLFLLKDYTVTHNSTIKQAIDLSMFGKTQGKNGKRLALKELPNRRNGSLYTGIYFENHLDEDIVMQRYIKPNDFKITKNGEVITERFKKMSDKEREKIIGYSYEIFKSFISMNINDFKNFISLNKEDKETLLNKLFNLNELDELFSITKELDKKNQNSIYEYENLIYDNETIITEYQQTIQSIKDSFAFSKSERLKELKEKILELKPDYQSIQNQLELNKEKKTELNIKFGKLKTMKSDKERIRTKFEIEIETINDKIKTFETGICPVCNSDLTNESHLSHLEDFKEQIKNKELEIEKCDKFLNKCILEDTKLRNNSEQLYNEKSSLEERFSALKIELGSLNKEYKSLKTEDEKENESTENLENKIKELKNKNKEYELILSELNIKSKSYDELKSILNFDGIRKTLISNAIKPINSYLSQILKSLKSNYTAELSDNFDATIYELGVLEINPETLSKGEDRKINIAIAISYLKIILEMKHSNVIFLDEIFDGLSMDNILLIIDILKELSIEYKTNIIIVAHGISEMKNFSIIRDKFNYLIEAKKDIFSDLKINKNV